MSDGSMSNPEMGTKFKGTLNIFSWNIGKAIDAFRSKEEEEMLSPIFVGKSIGLPNSPWQIMAHFNKKEMHLGVYIKFSNELNRHNPNVRTVNQVFLLNRNLEELYKSDSAIREFGTGPNIWGIVMIPYSELFRNPIKYLEDGILRIKVKLWIQNNEINKVVPRAQDLYQLHNDFSHLLDSAEFSDVEIVTPDLTLKAHKNILSTRCPVFSAMFKHDMSESLTNTVQIDDFKGKTVKGMLQFIYSGNVADIKEDYVELLKIADKYQLEALKTACINQALFKISVETVLEFLILGEMYNAQELKSKAIQFINSNKSLPMFFGDNGSEFKKFAKEHPQLLLEIYQHLRDNSTLRDYSGNSTETHGDIQEFVLLTDNKKLRIN